MGVFEFTTNPFGGIIIRPDALPGNSEAFRQQLRQSLAAWQSDGFKVVWLEVPIMKSDLIPAAVDAGFTFHHSGEDYLMMTHRLVENTLVPPYASHYIGAGGVVINDENELLVVHERGRGDARRSYKLPGGALHEGENLVDGVVREVLEETDVQTRFDAVVCLRNLHGYRYGKSDIYFVCRLTPLSREISMQADEIEDCRWMPLDEYFEADNVHTFNKSIVRAAMESPGLRPTAMDGYRDPGTYETFMPTRGER